MKDMFKLTLFLITISVLLAFKLDVNALSCTNEEMTNLNRDALTIKTTVEHIKNVTDKITVVNDVGTEQTQEIYDEYFTLKIINITDNFYVVVHNETNNQDYTFTSADAKDGIITYDWKDLSQIAKITVDVYTSNKTGCANEKLVTFNNIIPKYNEYFDTSYCEMNKDSKYCQEFIEFEISEETFNRLSKKSEKEAIDNADKEATKEAKVAKNKKMFKNVLIIGSITLGVLLVMATIVIIIKRRSRAL